MSVVEEKSSLCGTDLVIQYKWGFDGASGQSQYKQTFSSAESVADLKKKIQDEFRAETGEFFF